MFRNLVLVAVVLVASVTAQARVGSHYSNGALYQVAAYRPLESYSTDLRTRVQQKLDSFRYQTGVQYGYERKIDWEKAEKTADVLLTLVPEIRQRARDGKARTIFLGDRFWERYDGTEIDLSKVGEADYNKKVLDAVIGQRYGKAQLDELINELYRKTRIVASCTGYISKNECGDALVNILRSSVTAQLPWSGTRNLTLADRFQKSGDGYWINAEEGLNGIWNQLASIANANKPMPVAIQNPVSFQNALAQNQPSQKKQPELRTYWCDFHKTTHSFWVMPE